MKSHWVVLSFVDLAESGAPRTHVLEFSRALARHANVAVANPTPPAEVPAEEFEYVQCCPPVPSPARLRLLSAAWATVSCLRRLHRRKPLDVIYVRDNIAAIPTLVWAKLVSITTALEVNGATREEVQFSAPALAGWRAWFGRLRLAVQVALLGVGYRLADRVVVVTAALRNYMVERHHVPAEKVGVFGNGANVELFTPLDPVECRRKLNLDPRRRYIGFVGNLYKWQGVDDLVTAFSTIAAESVDSQLLIVGDGVEAPNLKSLVRQLGLADRVDFVGRIPYADVVYYVNACDFCVGPFNGWIRNRTCGASPLKISEYLACGKPVLTSDLEDMGFVAENGAGRLYAVDNIDALAAGLKAMLSLPPPEVETMSRRARRLAVERTSWDATVAGVFRFVTVGWGQS